MQIFQGKGNLLILTGGVPDSFKTDGGIKVKRTQKITRSERYNAGQTEPNLLVECGMAKSH